MNKSIIESFDTDKEDSAKKSQDNNEAAEKGNNQEDVEQAEQKQEVPKDTDKSDESSASATGEGSEATVSQSSEGQETTNTTQDEMKSTSAAADAKPTTIKAQKDVNNPAGLNEGMPINHKPFEDDGKVKDVPSRSNSDIKEIVSAMQKGNQATIAAMAKSNADTIATFMSAIGNLLPKQNSSQDNTAKADAPVDPAKNDSESGSKEPVTPKQDTPVQQEESKDLPSSGVKDTPKDTDDKKEKSSEPSEKGEKDIPDTVEHVDDDHDVYVSADGKEPVAKKDDAGKDTVFDDSKATHVDNDNKDDNATGKAGEKEDTKKEESMLDLFIRARGNLANYTNEYQQRHQSGDMTQEEYEKARNTVYNLMDGATISNFTREDLNKIANSKGAI